MFRYVRGYSLTDYNQPRSVLIVSRIELSIKDEAEPAQAIMGLYGDTERPSRT
jgi:hypothetical protein